MSAQWQWQDDTETFLPFDGPSTAALEAAHLRGDSTIVLRTKGVKYAIDFGSMTQTNVTSKKVRTIQRVGSDLPKEAPKQGPSSFQWQWLDDEGLWADYSPEDEAALEAAYASHNTDATIPMRGWTYDFDFKIWTQFNQETKAVRKIRRSVSPLAGTSAETAAHSEPPKKKAKQDPVMPPVPGTSAVPSPMFAWHTHNHSLLWRGAVGSPPCDEVYGFDLDSTLVETKTGKTFPTGRTDWKWLYPEVPSMLKTLHAEGKRIVVFSNQSQIGKKGWNEAAASQIRGKLDDIAADLGVPLWAFVATKDDQYRKPSTGMWDFLAETVQPGSPLDRSKCVYVGDAAGRQAGWMPGRKKDFACSDRKFAHNVGVTFKTPEEFFLKAAPAPFVWDGINPDALTALSATANVATKDFHKATQEMVVFCGLPAAGKTTFAKRHFVPQGYVHVNRDTLKTPKKCLEVAAATLAAGQSVVIDNTMPKFQSDDKDHCNGRDAYIKLGKKHAIPCRLFYFNTEEALAKHLNAYRERLTDGAAPHVPEIGYNVFKKAFEPPTLDEGWAEIETIAFVPSFPDARARTLFFQLT